MDSLFRQYTRLLRVRCFGCLSDTRFAHHAAAGMNVKPLTYSKLLKFIDFFTLGYVQIIHK